MKYEDLPPALKAQVDAKVGAPKKRTTKRQLKGKSPCRCRCGEEFGSDSMWAKHAHAAGMGTGHSSMRIVGLYDDSTP